jgi:hypothetical protein
MEKFAQERSVVQFAKFASYSEQALQLLGVRYLVHRLAMEDLPGHIRIGTSFIKAYIK